MRIRYTSRFGREAKKISHHLHPVIEEQIDIFRSDPFDSKLKTHKLSGGLKGFWSFSIDHRYRILFEFIEKEVVLFHSIGDHSIYD